MIVYDDKNTNAVISGTRPLITSSHSSEDVIFKASYIVSSELDCKGKVTALFDLVVFGDVRADEIDVKGRFICMGHCVVAGAIVVQNDMWCEDVQAASVTCHDRIVAQSIDADNIFAEGSIIVGKTLAIAEKAQTNQNVLCGETAYGAGKIVASSILTVEPLDLDEGEEALESPFQYTPNSSALKVNETSKESAKFEKNNDYQGYISALVLSAPEVTHKRLNKYLATLKAAEMAIPLSVSELRDVSILIWLIELSKSDYFKGWNTVSEWTATVLEHFKKLAEGKLSVSFQGKPADKILKGYTVSHSKFGIGMVEEIVPSGSGEMAMINFGECGIKKFPLPASLKFFLVLSETSNSPSEEIKSSMTCEISDYDEWLSALALIDENKECLGESLHNAIFELLLEKIGLKAKFVKERFKEKGWK